MTVEHAVEGRLWDGTPKDIAQGLHSLKVKTTSYHHGILEIPSSDL